MKNQKGLWGLVVVAIVVLACVGVYFLSKKPVSTDKAASTSTVKDETADWQTYQSTNPNFSFKYPVSWEKPIVEKQNLNTQVYFESGLSVVSGSYYNTAKGRNSTVLEIIDDDKKNGEVVTNLQTQNIEVDGHSAIKVTYLNAYDEKSYTEYFIYQDQQNKDKFIELSSSNRNVVLDTATLDKVLSTFKFSK